MTASTPPSSRVRRRISPAARAASVVAIAAGLASCIEVRSYYLDAPPETPDVPGADVPAMDTPGLDAPDAHVMIGADATRAVLASIGERVILADVRAFEAEAIELEAATNAALTGGETERAAARAAWREAMATWQRIEMVQVGPAGLPSVTVGGLALRDAINGWPLITRCRIDQNTVAPDHADPVALEAGPINARGLSSLEYLLFYDAPDNGCSAATTINVDGSWAALGEAEVARRRRVYAHSLATLIRQHATELRNAWEPTGGNFYGSLSTAGAGSTVYASAQLGLNAISDALVYLYKEVVDYKVSIPAGIAIECPTETCPEQVESRWAEASLDHLRANVEAFRDTYLGAPAGTDGPGFDDLVRSVGGADLDARVQAAIAGVFVAIDAVEAPLETAVVSDAADVTALREALRLLADLFRIEVVTLLDLQPAMRIEGDND